MLAAGGLALAAEAFYVLRTEMTIVEVLYVEVDDCCGWCRDSSNLTIHHLDGNHDNNAYDNQLVLCRSCHDGHHNTADPTAQSLADRKRHLITRTLTPYGVSALKTASRNGEGVITFPFLLWHLVELGYMTKEETQMTYGEIEATARFSATDGGKRLVKDVLK